MLLWDHIFSLPPVVDSLFSPLPKQEIQNCCCLLSHQFPSAKLAHCWKSLFRLGIYLLLPHECYEKPSCKRDYAVDQLHGLKGREPERQSVAGCIGEGSLTYIQKQVQFLSDFCLKVIFLLFLLSFFAFIILSVIVALILFVVHSMHLYSLAPFFSCVLSSLCHLLVLFLCAARWRLHQSFCFVLLAHFSVSDFLIVLVLIFMSFFYIWSQWGRCDS